VAVESISIDGRTYLAGMHWASVAQTDKWRAEAVDKAGGQYDLVTLWRTQTQQFQFGFASSTPRYGTGAHSLAAALAIAHGSNWVGICELPSPVAEGASPAPRRYALVAVASSGAIAHDVVGTATEITAAWGAYLANAKRFSNRINACYAPKDLGLEDVTELDLLGKLREAGPGSFGKRLLRRSPFQAAKLEQLQKAGAKAVPKGAFKRVTLSRDSSSVLKTVLVLGGTGVAVAWMVMDAMPKHQGTAAPKVTQPSPLSAIKPKHKQAIPPPPWKKMPDGLTFIAVCSEEFTHISPVVGGWKIESAVCGPDSTTLSYKRFGVATDQMFIDGAKALYGVTPDIPLSHMMDEGTVVLHYVGAPASAEELGHDSELAEVFSHFQALGVKVPTLTELPQDPQPAADEEPVTFPWKVYTLNITGTGVSAINAKDIPSQLFSTFDLPGFRISSITATRTDGKPFLTWDVKGSLYVTR
jgi:hypothetical protein